MAVVVCVFPAGLTGCKASGNESRGAASEPPSMSAIASTPPQTTDDAPPPEKTGSFDGKRAFAHVAKQVSFAPHPSASPAILQVRGNCLSDCTTYRCTVEPRAATRNTPIDRL